MYKCLPKMYKKNIFEIPYKKLKKKGIRCLIFDLDNTIALIDQEKVDDKTIDLIQKLKKDFTVVIISNNYKKRVSSYALLFDCDYVSFASKPLKKGFKKVRKKYNLKKEEIAVIGDQLVTDILGGSRSKAFTILVDPLGTKDLKITSINRFIEKKILKKYQKKDLLTKGVYYE